MIASTTPLMRRPMTGAGEAAADPGRNDGRLHCVAASTTTMAFEATSVALDIVLVRPIHIFWGRLLDVDLLGKLRRKRLRMLEWLK